MQTILRTFAFLSMLVIAAFAHAQGGPPPPPQPLGNPPVPVENPQTPQKILLGQALFWEEQLSVTGTVACGTCHRAFAGGSDPRSGLAPTINAGADGVLGTGDDVHGSAGVPAHDAGGLYTASATPQVGGRRAPSAVDAAFAPLLFWDGRAGTTFLDPATGVTLIASGGALENQALGPLVNSVEMAPAAAQTAQLAGRISGAQPLALAENLPAALASFVAGRGYPELFAQVFGDTAITPARIAFAIASYERTLVANQTPFDVENGGTPALTDLERQGRALFVQNDCAACHAGALTSDNNFHYIGVRPPAEDLGRFNETGNNADRGRMRTPSLRNVELRAPYMHNGGLATLEDVVDFYDRGGDFTAPNKDPRVHPRGLTAQQKAALVAFLKRPLTDPRAAAESGAFARPALYTESSRVPSIVGSGVAGAAGVPAIGAIEPPLLGNRNFTVSIANVANGAHATLVVSRVDPGVAAAIPSADFATKTLVLAATTGSVNIDLGDDPTLSGQTLYGRWYVEDASAPNGLAISPAFAATVFGTSPTLFRDDFE